MNALEKLRAACAKKVIYKSFETLAPGEYTVYEFSKIETKHGHRVRITLEDYSMYLPERVILDDDDITELNASPKIMIYGGKETLKQNRLILDFRNT